MVSISKEFTFSVNDSNPTKTFVVLTGAFRRGHIEPSDFQKYSAKLNEVERLSARGLVVFDLSALSYWDTFGINTVLPMIQRINQRHPNRAGIFGPTNNLVYQAALARHRAAFEAKLIPWSETQDAVLKAMTGEG